MTRSGTSTRAAALLAVVIAAACRERAPAVDGGPRDAALADAAPAARRASAPVAPDLSRFGYPGGSFAELVASAGSAVVTLRSRAPVRSGPAATLPGAPDAIADVALGTGFLIDEGGLALLTTARIASAAPELWAVLGDGSEVPVRVLGRDPKLDLALLAIDPPPSLGRAALPLGDSDELEVGQWLLVLGNPFGDEVTAAAGLVSATGRDAAAGIAAGSALGYRTFVQTDARIHRGNSGGPVLDTAGRVVGIATATSDRPTELSFVVPISRVREVLGSLRQTGGVTRSFLGALVRPVPQQLAATLGLARPLGALVTQVAPATPAAKAALRVGDVILRWGDREVDHRSLPNAVARSVPGQVVKVLVRRGATALELEVMPEELR